MTLSECLNLCYPLASGLRDYIIEDHGNGQVIAFWNEALLGPIPDLAQLQATAKPLADAMANEVVAQKTERDNAKTILDTLANITATEFRALTQNQKDTVLYHIMKREIRRLK